MVFMRWIPSITASRSSAALGTCRQRHCPPGFEWAAGRGSGRADFGARRERSCSRAAARVRDRSRCILEPRRSQPGFYWPRQIGSDRVSRPRGEWRGAKSLEEAIANPPPGQVPVVHDKTLIETRADTLEPPVQR